LGYDRVIDRRSFVLSAVAVASAGERALAQTAPTLHMIGPPNDGFKAVYYAVKAGIFKKYGVNVEVSLINSGAAAAAALIGGTADVAYTNITTLITAHNKGVPMQALAPGAIFNPGEKLTSAILVLKDAPIQSGRDLDGKTIGSVSLGDTMAAAIQAWIDQHGGDSHTVKIIEVPASAAVQMLQAGRTAAVAVNEPAVTQAIATGTVKALANPNAAISNHFLQALFAVMSPFADKYPDAMRRFARAMHESSVYTNSHLPETVDLVASYSGIAPDVVARSTRFIDAEYLDPGLIQPVIDVLVKYGVTDHTFAANAIVSPYALKRR
jgi:NitT/TauT family transport system substrate-binding protein